MTCNKPFISIGTGIAFAIIFGTAPISAAMDNALIRSMDERLKLVDARQDGEGQSEGGKRGKGHHGEGECAGGSKHGTGHYHERGCGGERGRGGDRGVKGALSGKQVYQQTCFQCHATGVQNAPRFGDKTAWAPLLTEGQHIVTAHGWVGQRGMPPRGGRADLSLEEFARGVAYMARAGGGNWEEPDARMLDLIREEEKKRTEELRIKK